MNSFIGNDHETIVVNDIAGQVAIAPATAFGLLEKVVPEGFVINLHAGYCRRCFLVAFAHHDSFGSCYLCLFATNIERHRVNEGFGINTMVIHGTFVPNFFDSFVIDIRKVSEKRSISLGISIFLKNELRFWNSFWVHFAPFVGVLEKVRMVAKTGQT